MKKAFDDIKSFMTVTMILLLVVLMIGYLFVTGTIPSELMTLFVASFGSITAYFFNKDIKRETNETTNTNETK